MPAELTNVDPAWQSCQPLWYGAFDPPRILTKASQLDPAAPGSGSVTSVAPVVPAVPATAQATPTPATPASTPTRGKPTTLLPQQNPPTPPPQNPPAQAPPPQAPPAQAPPPQAPPPQAPPAQAPPPQAPPPSPPPQDAPPPQSGKPQPSPTLSAGSSKQQPASYIVIPAVGSSKPVQTEPAPLLLDPGSGNLVQGRPPSHSTSPAGPVMQQSPQNTNVPPNIDPPPLESPKPVQNQPAPLFVDPGNGNLVQAKSSSVSPSPGNSGSQPAPQVPADPKSPDQNTNAVSPSPLFLNPGNAQIVQGNTPSPRAPSQGLGNQQAPQGSAGPTAITLPPSAAQNTPKPLFLDPGNGNIVQGNPPILPTNAAAMPNASPFPAGSTPLSASPEALPPLLVDGKPVPVTKLPGGEINVAGTILTPQAQVPKPVGAVSAVSNQNLDGSSQVAPMASNIGTYILQGINGDTTRVNAAITAGVAGTPIESPAGGSNHGPLTAVNPIVIGGTTYVSPVTAGPNALNTPTPQSLSTIPGHVVAVGGSNVLLDGTAHAFIPASTEPVPALSVNSHAIQQAPGGGLFIGDQTLKPGSQTTISGQVVSAGGNGNIVLDGTTHAVPPLSEATPTSFLVGTAPVQMASDGRILIGDQILKPGIQTTIAGQVVSAGGNGNIVLDGTTHAFPSPPKATPTPFLIGKQPVQMASDGAILVGDHTIAAGSETTVSGHIVSAGASGGLVVDGTTHAFQPTLAATPTPFLIGSQTIAQASNGALVVAGQTLSQGAVTTMSGHVISVGPSNILLDGTTYLLPSPPPTPTPFLIDFQTIAQASNGALILGSQTLSPGAQTTVSGHVLSIGTNALILDGTTHTLPSPSTPPTPIPLLVGSQSIQIAPNGALLLGSQTLSAGTQTTISGHVLSIGTNALILDGLTHALPSRTALPDAGALSSATLPLLASAQAQVFTIGGQVVTAAVSAFGAAETLSVGGQAVVVETAAIVVETGTGTGRVKATMTVSEAVRASAGDKNATESMARGTGGVFVSTSAFATGPGHGGSVSGAGRGVTGAGASEAWGLWVGFIFVLYITAVRF